MEDGLDVVNQHVSKEEEVRIFIRESNCNIYLIRKMEDEKDERLRILNSENCNSTKSSFLKSFVKKLFENPLII